MNKLKPFRRQRAYLSQFTTVQLHLKNPWVVAFFSFSYPGFGHLMQHRYAPAITLILWETFINTSAKINLGILYSLTGEFEKAKEVLDERWLIFYLGIYIFGIWDSYRSTVDLNKQYILAEREDSPIANMVIGSLDINYLDKRKPWVALCWSAILPGLGHLYIHKVFVGFFIFAYTVVICYLGHVPESIQYTMYGEFSKATDILNMQWMLFLPSIYFFIIYDAYSSTIEHNKLFEIELARYLRTNYQGENFKYPI